MNSDASGIFKFIANISAPAIIINILITIDISSLNSNLLTLYVLSELIIYLSAFLFCKIVLKLAYKDALLCGLAASFGNHVLFVYPVVLFAFPSELITPVKGIITVDIFIFTFTLILLDIMSRPEIKKTIAALKQIQNPIFMGMIIGLLLRFCLPDEYPILVRGSEFISYAAAPAVFLHGILLSQTPLLGNIKMAAVLTIFKMLLHPFVGFLLIIMIGSYSFSEAQTTLMVTVAPVGIMAVTFANRYKINARLLHNRFFGVFNVYIIHPYFRTSRKEF